MYFNSNRFVSKVTVGIISALVEVMSWCEQATSQFLNQRRRSSLRHISVTKPITKLTKQDLCYRNIRHSKQEEIANVRKRQLLKNSHTKLVKYPIKFQTLKFGKIRANSAVAGIPLTNALGENRQFSFMMTSSNGNIFRVTGHLCGEFTGPGEFPTQRPVKRSFDVFFDLRLNKRLSKQWWGWWFETLPCPLWRHCNVAKHVYFMPL